MTVSSTDSRWDYIQVGTLDSYEYKCEIYLKTDLKVYVSGILKTVNVHYIVTGSPPLYGINNPDGGVIVFYPDYIPAVGAPIAIILDLPLTQLIDYKEGDKFPAETHERALDRLIKIAQSFKEQIKKILKIPIYSTLEDVVIPIKAKSFLKWNDDATKILCVPEWEAGDPLPNHSEDHENEGTDEISVTDLSGLLADPQHVLVAEVLAVAAAIDETGKVPIAQIASGTPDGTKFVRDDRTLQNISVGEGEGHITILPWHYSSITQGTWEFVISASLVLNADLINSSNAQNDQINYKVYLAAGTYTFSILGVTAENRAILTLLIDDVSKGTIDWYGGTVVNVLKSITEISISTPGLVTLSLKAATRNGSSGGWYLTPQSMALFRTA